LRPSVSQVKWLSPLFALAQVSHGEIIIISDLYPFAALFYVFFLFLAYAQLVAASSHPPQRLSVRPNKKRPAFAGLCPIKL
jgi:hypothetical protein